MMYGKSEDEILENAFSGHILIQENGKRYVFNKIVYEGSEITKILTEFYSDLKYLPFEDFKIEF